MMLVKNWSRVIRGERAIRAYHRLSQVAGSAYLQATQKLAAGVTPSMGDE